MKKLEKLKLNQLSKTELEKREMNGLRGGYSCTCGCLYKNSGGSSTSDNSNANYGTDQPTTPCICSGSDPTTVEQNSNSIYNTHNS